MKTTQTTALPAVVPLLVTRGDPEVYPNDPVLVPAELRRGRPWALSP